MNNLKLNLVMIMLLVLSQAIASDKDEVICKQKEKVVDATYIENTNQKYIELVFKKEVEYFRIEKVRGLDGIEIVNYDSLGIDSPRVGQKLELSVSLNRESKLQYIVLDYSFIHDGNEQNSNITIPVGSITRQQVEERASRIKTISVGGKDLRDANNSSKGTESKKVHLMSLE